MCGPTHRYGVGTYEYVLNRHTRTHTQNDTIYSGTGLVRQNWTGRECHVPTTPIYIKVTKAAHLQTPTDTFRNNIRTVQIGDYKRSMGAGDAGDANDTIEQNGSDCK